MRGNSSTSAAYSRRATVLQPRSHWEGIDLDELWRYRELLWILAVRDIKVRYKQTIIGAAWAILQPLLTMIVFSIIFGRLARIPSDGVPYPLYAFCALLPWQLFSTAFMQTGNSVVNNQHLITKVYFPRLLIPLSSVLSALVDFFLAFLVLLGLMAYYGVVPTWRLVALPLFILFAILAALSTGLWLAALNVQYRDVRHVIPFLTQFWMFVTPVAYPSSLVPQNWRWLYGLNPVTAVVDGFRWCILSTPMATGSVLWISVLVVIALLVTGLFYFRRMEKSFADYV